MQDNKPIYCFQETKNIHVLRFLPSLCMALLWPIFNILAVGLKGKGISGYINVRLKADYMIQA